MCNRRFLLNIVLPIFFLIPLQLFSQNTEDVALSDESNLSINGTSNVNDFSCGFEQELSTETLSYSYQFVQDRVLIEGNTLYLDAEKFNCGKKAINRDFRKTLKVKEHPYIKITLKELFVPNGNSFPDEALVDIEIAGVIQEYIVPLIEIENLGNQVRVRGEKMVNITDFNLDPPTALFGLVKVREEMDVNFNLIITQNL